MSKRRRRSKPPSPTWSSISSPSPPSPSPSPPSDDDEWFAIKEILDERRLRGRLEYLVDWEGTDRNTGRPYSQSWVPAGEVTLEAIAEWQSGNSTGATHLQAASSRRRTAHESSSGGRTRAASSQEQPRATSLQLEERPKKRRRLTRAVTHPSSPVTSSQDRGFHSSQQWEAADSQDLKAAECVVELPSTNHINKSDYLSVHLSQTSAEGATQLPHSSQPRFSSQRHAVDSQRTIPDSQEPQSYETFNDPPPSEGLSPPSALPLAQPASTSDSWPSVVPRSQEQLASQEQLLPAADSSSPRLLRKPGGEAPESQVSIVPDSTERSEPSIPSRQPDSFPVQHDSQSGSVPSSHSVEYNALRTNGVHLTSLTRASDSASSGPEFLTQPQLTLYFSSTSQVSSQHPTNSGDKESRVPDSIEKSNSSAKTTQDQRSHSSHAADYGSAQPRDSLYYASQAVPNLLNSSEQLTVPESSSVVPGTVLRRPQRLFIPDSSESSSGSRLHQKESHPQLDHSSAPEVADPVDQRSPGPQVASPNMDNGHEPLESPALAQLLEIQRSVLSEYEEPSYFGSTQSAAADGDARPGDQPSPRGASHDPAILSSGVGDVQPDSIGSPFAPGAISRTGEEPSAPTSQLFATQEQDPGHGGASSQAESADPVTVAPGDIQPSGLDPFMTPSHIATSARLPTGSHQLPVHDGLFSERQHAPVDIPTDMTVSEEEEGEDDSQHRLPGYEPKEFIVTLPFPANQRPFYDDMILKARDDIESFCRIFSNEVLRTPKPSAVHKIDSLFLRLLDVCDYPPELDAASWDRMSPKEVQNYLYESNAKFSLIWDMLDFLRDMPMKVLIVARSERLLSFLENLAEVEGYAFSRTGLQDMQFGHARSPVNIVLALPDQALPDGPSEFDLVFGFDFEFKRSIIANRLAQLQPPQKRPMVLSLVIAHSLEHIDLGITDQDPDMPELDRKNALVVALTKVRGIVVNPEMGRAKPHKIAQHFANLLGGPAEPWDYEPIPLPDSVLDVYMDPTQPEGRCFGDEEGGDSSRKRKLDDFHENEAKRQKLHTVPMVNAKRVEALSPLIRSLGAEILDGGDVGDEVTVPRALLKAMEAKINEERMAAGESRKREQESKRQVASLSQQNEDYAKTINTIQAHHHAAIEERGKFEQEKKAAEVRVQSLETRLQTLDEEKAKLVDEVAELKAAATRGASGEQPTAAEPAESSGPEGDLEASRAEVQRLKKRVENAERDLEYTRDVYQTASRAAGDLGNENRNLEARIKDLDHRASENLLAVHKMNVENQVTELVRTTDELLVTLREREAEIDRLREELKTYKMRRETRQSSVPRSPRMGVMSPRARGVGGGVSRGSSPAPLEAGLQMFPQQVGNGRWGHLKD